MATVSGFETFRARARDFRRRYQAPEGLFWIRRVNHSLGAVIALLLFPTRVTPNAVTVAGFVAHLAGAAAAALLTPPAPIAGVLFVLVAWQLAFSLDCADGPLARARGQTSAFGAWFDQLVDSMSRAAVYAGLIVFLVRALAPDPIAVALLASGAVSMALLQTFSSWQRVSLIGGGSPVADVPGASARLLRAGQQLVDYGAFLFLASVLLLAPPLLLVFVVLSALVNALFVAAQLVLGWRRQRAESRGVRTG